MDVPDDWAAMRAAADAQPTRIAQIQSFEEQDRKLTEATGVLNSRNSGRCGRAADRPAPTSTCRC